MRYLGLGERLALHEPLDLLVEAAMGAAHLRRGRNPRSGRERARVRRGEREKGGGGGGRREREVGRREGGKRSGKLQGTVVI